MFITGLTKPTNDFCPDLNLTQPHLLKIHFNIILSKWSSEVILRNIC